MVCCNKNYIRSAISLAEEFEQLDEQNGTPPVVLQLPSGISNDSSSTHITSDNGLPGNASTEWSSQSPSMSPSLSNSYQHSPAPYLESPGSGESPFPMKSHDPQTSQRHKGQTFGSHDQPKPPHGQEIGSHDQQTVLHDQKRGSHDQIMDSHDAYMCTDSFSCPNLSVLESYGEKQQLYHNNHSTIWDSRHHDNCASMVNIHLQTDNNHDNHGNHHVVPTRSSYNISSSVLPCVVEESSPSTLMSPPSHIYKVMRLVWLIFVLLMLL